MKIDTIEGVEIFVDPDPQDPREWENLGTLCLDNSAPPPTNAIVLPIYCSKRSGIVYSTIPFDSDPVGYVWAPRGAEGLTTDQIRTCLIHEIETWSSYVNGEVYGFRDPETNEITWGFYGWEDSHGRDRRAMNKVCLYHLPPDEIECLHGLVDFGLTSVYRNDAGFVVRVQNSWLRESFPVLISILNQNTDVEYVLFDVDVDINPELEIFEC